jgi:hypothetical protein
VHLHAFVYAIKVATFFMRESSALVTKTFDIIAIKYALMGRYMPSVLVTATPGSDYCCALANKYIVNLVKSSYLLIACGGALLHRQEQVHK